MSECKTKLIYSAIVIFGQIQSNIQSVAADEFLQFILDTILQFNFGAFSKHERRQVRFKKRKEK